MMDDEATEPGKKISIKMRRDNARHGTKFVEIKFSWQP
jgi:hypothetical protein